MSGQEMRMLTVVTGKGRRLIRARGGETVLESLQRDGETAVHAPCGGQGRCGKCLVRVVEGKANAPTSAEPDPLGAPGRAPGHRFACMLVPEGDLVIEVPTEATATGNKDALPRIGRFTDPVVRKADLRLSEPTLTDQRPDEDRLLDALRAEGCRDSELGGHLLAELPARLRDSDWQPTLIVNDGTPTAFVDPAAGTLGVAIDIGTTTVAAYLLDLCAGRPVDVVSALNAQSSFGADVISRIQYASEHPDGLERLRRRIVEQLNGLVGELLERNGRHRSEVQAFSVVGNTTMLHLASGLSPRAIAAAPFVPVTTRRRRIPAAEWGLRAASGAIAHFFPSVSGYVGGDIVAAVLASGMAEQDPLCLLIDIGTNGELVLGNASGLFACSTAAGPAFEGAQIRHGVGGIPGAVDTVRVHSGGLDITTIDDEAPVGICGSGLVDLVAGLLREGLIDETGRMVDPAEATSLPEPLRGRVALVDKAPAVSVAQGIYLHQRDVRELQLAKAAIAAGIEVLVSRAGAGVEDIDTLYLAGGFGSYVRPSGAAALGLFPAALVNRVKVLGNAAGHGAILALLSAGRLEAADDLARRIRYLELSSSPEFQEAYVDHMLFKGL